MYLLFSGHRFILQCFITALTYRCGGSTGFEDINFLSPNFPFNVLKKAAPQHISIVHRIQKIPILYGSDRVDFYAT